jgi:4-amino-4-deoxy-L-arabinose transferase-like glycosyltransferase
MNLLKNTVAGMIIIGFLVASAYGLYYAFQFVVNAFAGLEAVQKTLLFTAAFTILLSAAMIAAALRGLGRRLQNRRLQEEKLAAYGDLIYAWRALVREPQRAIQPEEEQILHDIESHLILVAGPQVLRQYHRLKEIQREADPQSPEVFAQLEKVILEIRRDIGYADWGYKNSQFISVLFEFPVGESKHLKHSPSDQSATQASSE